MKKEEGLVKYEPGTLAQLGGNEILPEDERGYEKEKPLLVYCHIRQKPKMSLDGKKTLKEPGAFMFQDPVAGEIPDQDVIEGVIIGSTSGRVYFKGLTDTAPTCKSTDRVHGSRPREEDEEGRPRFGECATCECGAFLEGRRPPCSENRILGIARWVQPRLFILTVGPSGLKPWRVYDQKVLQEGRKAKADLQTPPHHLTVVRITTGFKEDPKPHYVPEFELLGVLPKDQRDAIRLEREQLFSMFKAGAETQEYRAEDYVGPKNDDEDVPF